MDRELLPEETIGPFQDSKPPKAPSGMRWKTSINPQGLEVSTLERDPEDPSKNPKQHKENSRGSNSDDLLKELKGLYKKGERPSVGVQSKPYE